MINYVYMIYDRKAEEYGPVFEAKNDAVAKRKCKLEFKNVPGLDDYDLYVVGLIDHDCGMYDYLDEDVKTKKICCISELFEEAS